MAGNNKVFLQNKFQVIRLFTARKKYIFVILGLLSFLSVIAINHFSTRSPITACHSWGFAPTNTQVNYTHPQKIVVNPWKGQHHVYGVFEIPGGYLNEPLFTVSLPGERTFCGVSAFKGVKSFDGIEAKPGHYLMKGMLNTRVALWLIIQGKGDKLNQPQYWKMGYVREQHT